MSLPDRDNKSNIQNLDKIDNEINDNTVNTVSHDKHSNDTDSDISYIESAYQFIGGSNIDTEPLDKSISHSAHSQVHGNLKRQKSIYEDDPTRDSSDEEDKEALQEEENEHYLKENDSTISQYREFAASNKAYTHKTFSFSLPFGGSVFNKNKLKDVKIFKKLSNIVTQTPLDSEPNKFAIQPENADVVLHDETETDKQDPLPTREEVKNKLKRQESISSLEEIILFDNSKGVDNSNLRALKKLITPEIELKIKNEDEKDIRVLTHELEGDVIMIGGYRGSKLRLKSTGERIWIPLKNGLRINKNTDLVIGPRDEDQKETTKTIVPDGPITHIGPVDINKKLIVKLKRNPKVKVHKYGYDWRLDLDISSKDFHHYIKAIVDKQPENAKKGVYIVAHSMGGLVAHKVLQDHTELIRGIIYCGSPAKVPNILGPLRHGDQVLFNKTILSCEANFFMRSSFYFLPEDGRVFINDKDMTKKYDLDYFDWKTWTKYGLSPLVDEEFRNQAQTKKPKTGLLSELASVAHATKLPFLGDSSNTSSKESLVNGVNNEETNGESNEVGGTPDGNNTFRTEYNDCVEYLKVVLPRAKAFLESLEYMPDKKYPPLAQVYSRSVSTSRGCKLTSLDELREGNYDNFYYGPGDGVVYYKWLLPEQKGFPVGKFETEEAHAQLMTDIKTMSRAFKYLLQCEKKHESR